MHNTFRSGGLHVCTLTHCESEIDYAVDPLSTFYLKYFTIQDSREKGEMMV